MIAIDVAWKHAFDTEPVRLVSVLDRDRYEVRKLEFFRDGRVGFADETRSSQGTALGTVPVPSLVEINEDPEFDAQETTLEMFDTLWSCHVAPIDNLDQA
ncbi:hypothetical protein VL15_36155 [Burkholderia cepacia]|uniref:DUF6881 domain-containing protein n=1 Tax=Burkholderia cepacia TaxID=292 RepID=A0A0J5Z8I6_BURCE|nr:hypothetical protein [Burkholderia cepacia]KML46113.1 hypothetical protein VL15_36155 [Burkholderia cepacia]